MSLVFQSNTTEPLNCVVYNYELRPHVCVSIRTWTRFIIRMKLVFPVARVGTLARCLTEPRDSVYFLYKISF